MFERGRVQQYYDKQGIQEWERLGSSAHRRLIYHLHWRFLREHAGPGAAVLDAGCGAGRFSVAMAEAGSAVTCLDLSGEQLRIAREKVGEAGVADRVRGYARGDVRRLPFPDASFDTTVCFGAVLNYLFGEAETAARELVRVTRPGGTVLVSVSGRWGVLRFVAGNDGVDPADFLGRPEYWHLFQVAETGDLPAHPQVPQPPRHFFEADEIAHLLSRAGLREVQLAPLASLRSCPRADGSALRPPRSDRQDRGSVAHDPRSGGARLPAPRAPRHRRVPAGERCRCVKERRP